MSLYSFFEPVYQTIVVAGDGFSSSGFTTALRLLSRLLFRSLMFCRYASLRLLRSSSVMDEGAVVERCRGAGLLLLGRPRKGEREALVARRRTLCLEELESKDSSKSGLAFGPVTRALVEALC